MNTSLINDGVQTETAQLVDHIIDGCLTSSRLTSGERMMLINALSVVIEHTARVTHVVLGSTLMQTGNNLIDDASGSDRTINIRMARGATLINNGEMMRDPSRADIAKVVDLVIAAVHNGDV